MRCATFIIVLIHSFYKLFHIYIASKAGHIELTSAILNSRLIEVGVNDQDDSGCTAAYYASERGHTAIIKYLFLKKADFSLTSKSGKSSRDVAATPKIVRLIDFHLELRMQEEQQEKRRKSRDVGAKSYT